MCDLISLKAFGRWLGKGLPTHHQAIGREHSRTYNLLLGFAIVFYWHAVAIASWGCKAARVMCLGRRHALQRLRHTDASHTGDGHSQQHIYQVRAC